MAGSTRLPWLGAHVCRGWEHTSAVAGGHTYIVGGACRRVEARISAAADVKVGSHALINWPTATGSEGEEGRRFGGPVVDGCGRVVGSRSRTRPDLSVLERSTASPLNTHNA